MHCPRLRVCVQNAPGVFEGTRRLFERAHGDENQHDTTLHRPSPQRSPPTTTPHNLTITKRTEGKTRRTREQAKHEHRQPTIHTTEHTQITQIQVSNWTESRQRASKREKEKVTTQETTTTKTMRKVTKVERGKEQEKKRREDMAEMLKGSVWPQIAATTTCTLVHAKKQNISPHLPNHPCAHDTPAQIHKRVSSCFHSVILSARVPLMALI